MVTKKILLTIFICICGLALFGQTFSEQDLIQPDVATEINYEEGLIVFNFQLQEKHHITDLKYNFFKIEIKENEYFEIGNVFFPEGSDYKGEKVFVGDFMVKVYIKTLKAIKSPIEIGFSVSYQICQEEPYEVCFQPDSMAVSTKIEKQFKTFEIEDEVAGLGFLEKLKNMVMREFEKKSVMLFLLIFLAGFLTSFTPCVYPVIPIIMGYIGTRSKGSRAKGFYLSLFFVLGLATVYSILGVIAAMTGSLMGLSFQLKYRYLHRFLQKSNLIIRVKFWDPLLLGASPVSLQRHV